MAINEEVYKNLGLKGFLGALPERIYKHLGSLGHVGTISDRLFKEGGYLSYITNLLGGSNELVTNGDFATDLSGYTFNAGVWEWDNGKASKYTAPSSDSLEQLFSFVNGKVYSITVEWSDVSGGNPVLIVGNANTIIYPETTAIVIGANQSKFSLAGNAALFKVDNISIVEVAP